jgi:hypothetical protein
LTDKTSVFILTKLLPYMTGMEFGHCMSHIGSLMAEVDVLVEERGDKEALRVGATAAVCGEGGEISQSVSLTFGANLFFCDVGGTSLRQMHRAF